MTMDLRPIILLLVLSAALGVSGPAPAQEPEEAPPAAGLDLGGEQAPQMTTEERIEALNEKVMRNAADHQSWNDLGVIYAQQEEWDQARDAFIRAVQGNPQYADYHRNLGMTFSRLDDYDLAIAEFQAYQRFDTLGSRDFWRLIASAQIRAGRLDDARKTYHNGLEGMAPDLGSEGFRLVLGLNKLEVDAGNDEAVRALLEKYSPMAEDYLNRFGQDGPGSQEARAVVSNRVNLMVEDAKVLEESGLLLEAAARYEEARTLAPGRNDLLPRLVGVYLKAGEDVKAGVAARLARDEHPDEVGTWIASGQVYEHGKRPDDALAAYQQAYAMDSEFPDLRLAIGNLLMKMGRDSEAAIYLKEGITNTDTKPEVAYNYAVSQIREKKYHAAIASLRKVVDDRPDMTPAWIALAQCLRVTKQYGAAVGPYRTALEQQPDPKLAYNLGICAQKSSQPEKAIAAYEQALVLDPAMVEARYNLSLIYMDVERYEDAVASFELMTEIEPESYRVYYSKGLAYYYLGMYDEALDAYDQAADQKETAAVLNNIGLVYDKLGNKKEARKWYKMAKEL